MRNKSNTSRRQFLGYMAAAGATAGMGGMMTSAQAAKPGKAPRAGDTEILGLTTTEAVAALMQGDLTAVKYMEVLLDQADAVAKLNIFTSLDRAQIMNGAEAADTTRSSGRQMGPLHGVPVALKDLLNTSFAPTTAATPGLAGNNPKNGNAELTDALLKAGAIAFGKANMHELSFGATSVNPHTGSVGNPYKPSMIAGGSSGGPAAAVAARVTPASIGGDTAGSIRIPASLSGVCGLRPTVGNWPGSPDTVVPISSTRDTLGPMARSCADLELLDRVVTGAQPVSRAALKGLRLAKIPLLWSDLESGVGTAAEGALDRLRAAGVTIVEAEMPGLLPGGSGESFNIMLFEAVRTLSRYLDVNTSITLVELIDKAASPDVAGLYKSIMPEFGGKAVTKPMYDEARAAREALRSAYQVFFQANKLDALVFPTTVVPATPIAKPSDIGTLIHNTDAGSMAGIPGVSQPIGLAGGLPVGLGIDGLPGSDRKLLSIAMGMEADLFPPLPPPPMA